MIDRAVAITCEGISKSFALVDRGNAWRVALGLDGVLPRFQALRNVSFDVPKGQFVGVLGRNGAGKSTLLRILGGVYAADSGRVSIRGAMSGLYELGLVGNPQLTGRRYADRLLKFHGFSTRGRAAMIADIRDFSELGERFDDPVQTYSSGMGARLYFATATAGLYDVYLLDEILSVGDQHFQAKCWRRLRDRIFRGASGVLVTHDWSAILKICETAYILDKGRVVFSGPPARAVRTYLYGDDARQVHREGVAHFATRPAMPIRGSSGDDLTLDIEAEILTTIPVSCTFVIERLQPGFGWETALMSRKPSPIGETPGRYAINILIPQLPLDTGLYQIGIDLLTPDLIKGPPFVEILDSWGWLNGNGIALEVTGDSRRGLSLPLRWRVEKSQRIPA